MRASKSSASSPRFNLAVVGALLAILGIGAAWWCFARGYTLFYGDAEAHLNIARRILDSRTPGPDQIGTVWLPLPHLVLIPFAVRDFWWRSGLAGVIPSVACFVIAGMFLFSAARRAYGSGAAALAATLLFAINPSVLYLQATPMTEPLFLASLAALLWATLWFRDSQSVWAVLLAAAASNAASLTRYEGWFLVPFVTLYFAFAAKRKSRAILFAALAALGPLAWLAHNQYYYGNALEFYNGPYSAAAIYRRQLAQGGFRYPGDHNWIASARYYLAASRWVAGWPLLILAALGTLAALARRVVWPLFVLFLPPLFYLWSMHSSGTPIFVPDLAPFSWYNTRYAIAAVPFAAFAAAALVSFLPARMQLSTAFVLALTFAGIYAFSGPSICWKESEVNSEARRAWTAQAGDFLARRYRSGSGIVFPFGDLAGVLRQAGVPLREALHEGNGAAFDAAMARPDLFLHEAWGLAFSGDAVDRTLHKAGYALQQQVVVKGAPVVNIYHRN